MSSFASETGNKLAGSFKDATEDRQECGLTRTQRFRVVRHFVRCFHAVLWAGLAVHPSCRHQTDEVRVSLLYWPICSVAAKFMLNGPRTQLRLMVEWRKLPYSLALVASTLLTLYACFVLGNFFGRGGVGVLQAPMWHAVRCCVRTTRFLRGHAGRDCGLIFEYCQVSGKVIVKTCARSNDSTSTKLASTEK